MCPPPATCVRSPQAGRGPTVSNTWDGRAKSHNGDGRDRVVQADAAAEVGGDIADEGRQQADHHHRAEEAGPAVPSVYDIGRRVRVDGRR